MAERQGPLAGVRIVEMTGIGPVPYAAMLMADLGAEIIRIDRPGGYPAPDPTLDFSAMEAASIFYRSRPLVRINLKSEAGRATVTRLIGQADALIEGYRPGAMEKLGLGPEPMRVLNPRLTYVRVTGWGQEGPMARMAGHDLNYIGLSGALSLFGRNGAPPVGLPPLVGDMAGGSLFAVIGLLSGVISARATGQGQVVDANIVDGTASLYTLLTALAGMGLHGSPGSNVLDGGRYYYRTYACADGGHVAVGAIEPGFRKILLERLDISDDPRFAGDAPEDQEYCTKLLSEVFRRAPRAHWETLFHDTDGCVTGVLSPDEAINDPRNRERGVFTQIDGVWQSAPAPRFSDIDGRVSLSPKAAGRSAPSALIDWGFTATELDALLQIGAVEG